LTTHAVYWSTMLMALDLPLPETVFAHGWWTVDGEKMSKSRGNVVDPNDMATKYGVYAFRYFLLREVPFGQDGDFSEAALVGRINSDLANGLGNLLSRTLTLIEKFCDGVIPEHIVSSDSDIEQKLTVAGVEAFSMADSDIENMAFSKALEQIWQLVRAADQYLEFYSPWTMAKDPSKRKLLNSVLYRSADSLRLLAIAVYPFMPSTGEAISQQLGINRDFKVPITFEEKQWNCLRSGTRIKKAAALFPRIEMKSGPYAVPGNEARLSISQGAKPVSDTPSTSQPTTGAAAPTAAAAQVPTSAVPAQITIEEFQKLQLKTAKVLSAERVPKSEKLLKLQVSLGTEQRQIVAGIGKRYEPESLIGKTIVIVANLKPAKLMGIESQGMVLAAGDSEVRGLATFVEDVEPGTKVK
jgi:methionyl-tRNA synthetase